jgi:hypothetical protein
LFAQPQGRECAHSPCLNLASIRITMASHRPPMLHTDTQCARDARRQHGILVGHTTDETLVCWSLCASQISKCPKRATTLEGEGEASSQPMRVLAVTSAPSPLPTRSLYPSISHAHTHCKCDRRPMQALYSGCMVVPWSAEGSSSGVPYMGDGHMHGMYTPKW